MNTSADLAWLMGIVISVLLSLVVYFVRLLHVDFRRMQKDVAEVKATTLLIRSESKGGLDLVNQRVGQLEPRVRQLEMLFFKTLNNAPDTNGSREYD